jgi:hypothetical protein
VPEPGKGHVCACVHATALPLESGRVVIRDAGLKEVPNPSPHRTSSTDVLLFEISLPPVYFRSDRVDLHKHSRKLPTESVSPMSWSEPDHGSSGDIYIWDSLRNSH